jgi:hypothetical protein
MVAQMKEGKEEMTTDIERAFANGRAWYAEIEQLVQRLETAEEQAIHGPDETEAVRTEIEQGPLSVMVRDGWHQPGAQGDDGAEEYEILLSTGGPALRIYGKLDRYEQPSNAELQAQDWGTDWTRVPDCDETVLLAYANCFYFGEG